MIGSKFRYSEKITLKNSLMPNPEKNNGMEFAIEINE